MFLTFEGGEGVGKTTLIASLQLFLTTQGIPVLVTREPGGTVLGKKIRQLLLENQDVQIAKKAELLLFLADRAQHVEEVIQPFLKKGGIVLCDRFIDSSFAYQSGVFSMNDLLMLNTYATGNLFPDKTFYLDLDPSIGLKRIQQERKTSLDKMEIKGVQFHQEVRSKFLELATIYPERILKIDASQSKESVYNQVKDLIMGLIHEKSIRKHSSNH
jgi:dTMP kinase